MAEETGTPAPEAPEKPQGDSKTFTQEQVNDLIAREKGKLQSRYEGFDEIKAKAEELDRIKEENASEVEKAQRKATRAEQEAAEAKSKLIRYEVAAEKQIPAEALDLLTGNTREELEAKADKLLELVKSRTETDTQPDFDGGAREPAPEPQSPEDEHNAAVLALLGLTPNNT